MSSCSRSPEKSYQEAQALFQSGDFRASLEKAQRALQKWPAGEWGWQFRLLSVEDLTKISQGRQARAVLDAAGQPPTPALQARAKMDRSNLSGGASREQLLREAVPLASASHDPAILSLVELYLSEAVRDPSEAAVLVSAALSAAIQAHSPFLVAWVQLARGFNSMRFARYDEAVAFLGEAAGTARQCGARSLLASITGNQGWCYYHLGDSDRAMQALSEAESLSSTLAQPDLRLRWLGDMGTVLFSKGDFDRAAALCQQTAKLAAEVGNDEWLAIAWHNLAQIAIEKGDLATAREYSAKELDLHKREGNPAMLVSSQLTAAQIEYLSKNFAKAEADYQAVIAEAPRAHAPDVLWEAQSALASFYAEQGQPQKAAEQYRNAIRTIDRQWNDLNSDQFKTTFLSGHLVGLFQDYVRFLIQTGHMAEALAIAESARARILSRRLERFGEVPPEFNLAALQREASASHTVILSYWLAPRRSSVWVIGSGSLARFDLPPGREIDPLVNKHMEAVTQGRDPLAQNGGDLYKAVLGPVAQSIPAGSNVLVVPHGSLHQLSFETLVVPTPQPHYWIEDVAVATAPSLRVLAAEATKPAGPPRLLIFGDPVLTDKEFGPLPNAEKEIAAVQEGFPQQNRVAFVKTAAVPGQYAKASPAGFTNIHFATHATANKESPLDSAIILSHDGENFKLYARDVAGLHLTAQLVTISACTSAGANAYSGEGLMGFAWAFLQAGAHNVIASLWDVDDASSVELMRHLYAALAAGQSPPRALRAAKLELLKQGGRGRLPYYWGPLEVFTRRIAR